MIPERMLEFIILRQIIDDYDKNNYYFRQLSKEYNLVKLEDRYYELGMEFLNEYALDKTEKSD